MVHNALKVRPLFSQVVASLLWKPFLSGDCLNVAFLLLQLAYEAHDGQKRRSGEPFITHPVEVARILGELVRCAKYSITQVWNVIHVAFCNLN